MKICSILLVVIIFSNSAWAEAQGIDDAKIAVYFAPGDGCTAAIAKAIDGATSSIRVLAYHLTSPRICKAIVDAQKRGLSVEVILDHTQNTKKYSSADFLLHEEVSVRIDNAHTIAHNKVIVIDDKIVVTGSFNFTSSAETKNAENLLIIESPKLAAAYLENYAKLRKESTTYQEKDAKIDALPPEKEAP